MIEILLTQGKVALIDDEDYELVSQYKWYAHNRHGYWYATHTDNKNKKVISMHRLIMGVPKEKLVDHQNRNTLDNRKENLRICTRSQNLMNQKRVNGTSKYKGVFWYKRHSKWNAYISFNKKRLHLGYFENEIDAAKAYDKKAKELFGEFALSNF